MTFFQLKTLKLMHLLLKILTINWAALTATSLAFLQNVIICLYHLLKKWITAALNNSFIPLSPCIVFVAVVVVSAAYSH